MAERQRKTDFVFEEMDWEAYTKYRPAYSAAVYRIIYDYHQTHAGLFSTALDIGAGNGIITKELLHRFTHVTFSDASDLYIQQAKTRFRTVPKHTISFSRWRFGYKNDTTQPPPAPLHSLDLIAAGEWIHYAPDLDTLILQASNLLQPNGTFATFQYGFYPIFGPGSEDISAAYTTIMNKWFASFSQNF